MPQGGDPESLPQSPTRLRCGCPKELRLLVFKIDEGTTRSQEFLKRIQKAMKAGYDNASPVQLCFNHLRKPRGIAGLQVRRLKAEQIKEGFRGIWVNRFRETL